MFTIRPLRIMTNGICVTVTRTALLYLIALTLVTTAFPEQGKWDYVLNETESYFGVYKSLFNGSKVCLKVRCSSDVSATIKLNWMIRKTPCWEEYASLDLMSINDRKVYWNQYFNNPTMKPENLDYQHTYFYKPPNNYEHRCDNTINLPEHKINKSDSQSENKIEAPSSVSNLESSMCSNPITTVPEDGVYLLVVWMTSNDDDKFNASIQVEMKSTHGYLSAADWPLLSFYGGTCILYVFYGLAWLGLSFCQWRDLLRIQFWIGAVIFLGMVEMAVFYAEYQSINSTGISVTGAVLIAEIISCAKRTLARMLVVIVSIGFGIVKPRLGPTLHRIIVVGCLYFFLASVESSLRLLHPVNGPSNRALIAGVPLSILDAGICWWIFHSLVTTTRTLRLRRNLVKLGLYRHFTNTLIFSVVASVAFMIWSIKFLKTAQCLRDWKEIWVDEAYWHMLFSVILLVIMILWRPTNNNQRYSFSPLIDNPDDEEEEDLVVNESFGNMKLRPNKGNSDKYSRNRNTNIEDELRWVEENIPSDLAEGDLPALDSEEELISTKFELSKMQ